MGTLGRPSQYGARPTLVLGFLCRNGIRHVDQGARRIHHPTSYDEPVFVPHPPVDRLLAPRIPSAWIRSLYRSDTPLVRDHVVDPRARVCDGCESPHTRPLHGAHGRTWVRAVFLLS